MRTSEATWFGSGFENLRGMTKIGLSYDIDDVLETVFEDVVKGGSKPVVVDGISETTIDTR